jgi:hypothetical protein
VKDIRKDLGIAKLPFVIANTGMGGWDNPPQYKAKVEKLMDAQLALADPKKPICSRHRIMKKHRPVLVVPGLLAMMKQQKRP